MMEVTRPRSSATWVGRWVGGWVVENYCIHRTTEEKQAVKMSYCKLWVGG